MYGICIDERMGSDDFEYLIADNYNLSADVPDGLVTRMIPKHSWAILHAKVQCRTLCKT